jgi:hypothetical protein
MDARETERRGVTFRTPASYSGNPEVLLEKIIVTQLVKKLRRFIPAFTRAWHWTLS